MATKKIHPIFLELTFGVLTILSFGIYLVNRGIKDKNDFTHFTGQIIFYSDTFETFPHLWDKNDKYKYLQIDTYPEVFEIYVPFSSSNSIFQYSKLKVGDTIEIYFDKDNFAADKRVNKNAMFIDKGTSPILISISNDKAAGGGFIITSAVILIGLCILKKTGRIE